MHLRPARYERPSFIFLTFRFDLLLPRCCDTCVLYIATSLFIDRFIFVYEYVVTSNICPHPHHTEC